MKKNFIPNAPLPDATKLMSYQIVETIARGGSSFVYLAENKKKQLVAIKEYMPHKIYLRDSSQLDLTIPSGYVREFRQGLKTFFSECRTLSCIEHPGIVRLIDFFRAYNTFYLVTNYAPGSSLKEFMRRRLCRRMGCKQDSLLHAFFFYRYYKKRFIESRQVIGERLLKKVFSHVIEAMNTLHDQQFIYLDLKPSNIYLQSDGTPFLLDLGAARRTLEKNRKRLSWVHTQGYAAPELLHKRRERMGPWTDAYSIGATIFSCMCGYPPQPAEQREVKDRMPQSFKKLRKLYSGDLLDLVEWCLQLDSERRPQNMSALQERLQAFQPRHAPLPKRNFIRRFSKWFRKKIETSLLIARHN